MTTHCHTACLSLPLVHKRTKLAIQASRIWENVLGERLAGLGSPGKGLLDNRHVNVAFWPRCLRSPPIATALPSPGCARDPGPVNAAPLVAESLWWVALSLGAQAP